MKEIRWTKSYSSGPWKVPNYKAKIGPIELQCRPSIKFIRNYKTNIIGWTCFIYFEGRQIGHTPREQLLEFTQKAAEVLAIKYLLGHSLTVLKSLKGTGLLEDVLFEIGIDL